MPSLLDNLKNLEFSDIPLGPRPRKELRKLIRTAITSLQKLDRALAKAPTRKKKATR